MDTILKFAVWKHWSSGFTKKRNWSQFFYKFSGFIRNIVSVVYGVG